jgi:ABC-2 type transport system permease protein
MIHPAILRKTVNDSATLLIAASFGMIGFVILFVWAMLNLGDQVLEFASRFAVLRKVLTAGLGIRLDGEVSINILFAVSFTHAVVLALAWAVIIACSTRVTVGEIERGTADLLLSLPVTRNEIYVSTSLAWILSSGILACCPIVGIWIGSLIFDTPEEVIVTRHFKPALNFLCLLLAVGGISSFAASCANRRGSAAAIVVALVLVSSVLNFVEPFIESIRPLRVLSLLHYFRPVDVVRSGTWPWASMAVLLIIAIGSWLGGLLVFRRRDIPVA